MTKNNTYTIDIGGMKSAILKEDGSLTIMARKSVSDFTEHDWDVIVLIRPTGVKNIKALLARAAEHRNEAEESIREACPAERHAFY